MSDLKNVQVRPQGRRALVADDDPVMRSLLRSRLALLVDDVVEAKEGLEAWKLLSSERFDLALVDLMMPGLDGFGLIGCLRGHPHTRHMPIVVVTSKSDRGSIERALEAGASSFMIKPLAWATFNAHIGHLMRLASAAESAEQRLAAALADAASAQEAMGGLVADLGSLLAQVAGHLTAAPGDAAGRETVAKQVTDARARLETVARQSARLTGGIAATGPHDRAQGATTPVAALPAEPRAKSAA